MCQFFKCNTVFLSPPPNHLSSSNLSVPFIPPTPPWTPAIPQILGLPGPTISSTPANLPPLYLQEHIKNPNLGCIARLNSYSWGYRSPSTTVPLPSWPPPVGGNPSSHPLIDMVASPQSIIPPGGGTPPTTPLMWGVTNPVFNPMISMTCTMSRYKRSNFHASAPSCPIILDRRAQLRRTFWRLPMIS